MSKSVDSPLGTIGVLDDPSEIERKVKKAVTDPGDEVCFDPEGKPGVSNLVELLAAATDRRPEDAAGGYTGYGQLKRDVAEALIELLRPIRERHTALVEDPATVVAALARGAERAREVAGPTYRRAAEAVGLFSLPE
jgi:tryptophanyl-tRNA synthetase